MTTETCIFEAVQRHFSTKLGHRETLRETSQSVASEGVTLTVSDARNGCLGKQRRRSSMLGSMVAVNVVWFATSCVNDSRSTRREGQDAIATEANDAQVQPDGSARDVNSEVYSNGDSSAQFDSSPPDALQDTSISPESNLPETGSPPPDSGIGPEPISQYCGDAIRDPILEQCDDGPTIAADDSCTSDCRVRDAYVTPPEVTWDAGPLYTVHRALGSAPHVIASSRKGFAIVYSETSPSVNVFLQAFDYNGHRLGNPILVSQGRLPTGDPNPVVDGLSDGTYVVAWTDGAGGTPDVVMRSVDPVSRTLGGVQVANATIAGAQQDPDLVISGTTLVAAWTDLFSVHVRRFDLSLGARGGEEALPTVTGVQGGVSLAATSSGWALAWHANDAGLDSMHVVKGSASWQTEAALPAPAGDRPALVSLSNGELLLLFDTGNAGADAASPSGGVRWALLDTAATGAITSAPLVDPEKQAGGAYRPRALRVGAQVFATWEFPGMPYSKVTLAQLAGPWSGAGSVSVAGSWPLSITSFNPDLTNPALTAMPRYWDTVLVGTWENAKLVNGRTNPDLEYVVRPWPFIRPPADAGLDAAGGG